MRTHNGVSLRLKKQVILPFGTQRTRRPAKPARHRTASARCCHLRVEPKTVQLTEVESGKVAGRRLRGPRQGWRWPPVPRSGHARC